MSPDEILAGLETQLGVLGGGGRLAPAHHRTVRAAVEWSYELLDPAEQDAFRTLAVFVGGFDADAASALRPGLSLEVLARLVDKSLVTVMQSPRGRTRYRLLETVRAFARGLVADAGELEAARERHFRHFASLADVAREEWRATGKQWFVNQLDDDYENVRAALEWSVNADPCAGTRVMGATRDLFFRFGQADGARLAPLLLERCDEEDRYRVEAQIAASQFAATMGEFAEADRILSQARQKTPGCLATNSKLCRSPGGIVLKASPGLISDEWKSIECAMRTCMRSLEPFTRSISFSWPALRDTLTPKQNRGGCGRTVCHARRPLRCTLTSR